MSLDESCFMPYEKSVHWRPADQKEISAGLNKYYVLYHEVGHAIDFLIPFTRLHYSEVNMLADKINIDIGDTPLFPRTASVSDEFLEALRADREQLKNLRVIKSKLPISPATVAIQDAIVVLFDDWKLGRIFTVPQFVMMYSWSILRNICRIVMECLKR